MEKLVAFEVDTIEKIELEDYSDEEFAIARMGYLSTKPNTHQLHITEEVLQACAKTALNKWVVADMQFGEPTTHTKNEHIVGKIPKEQAVEFVRDEDGYLRAYVDTVISKIYAKDFCEAFTANNNRAVSVEMQVTTTEEDENEVVNFNIVGVTVLGKTVRPSCPDSDITFTRFSAKEANKFFKSHRAGVDTLAELKKFAQDKAKALAEQQEAKKTYKIDKSKDALSDTSWGDVDKEAQRDKIMEAANRDTLVKAVYLLIEDGWEEAPSEKLKYPVMELKDDTFVYNRGALSSALAYAKQHDEDSVVNKVEEIYKDLDIEIERKEDKNMQEIEFAAVEIGDLWSRLYDAIYNKHPSTDWGSEYRIDGIYEEDNQKFAIIKRNNEDDKYRLNFSLTEEGLTLADEITKVEVEIVETDVVRKFAEVEDAELMKKYTQFEECGEPAPARDFEAEVAELNCKLEEKENIIMGKDEEIAKMTAELEELRAYKAGAMEKEKASAIESVLAEVAKCFTEEQCQNFRAEGLACEMAEIDGWANKVRATAFTSVAHKNNKPEQSMLTFAAPVHTTPTKSGDIWSRLEDKYKKN